MTTKIFNHSFYHLIRPLDTRLLDAAERSMVHPEQHFSWGETCAVGQEKLYDCEVMPSFVFWAREFMKDIGNGMAFQITDIWKKQNIIDVSMPLTIRTKFKYKKVVDLDHLKNIFYKISMIDKSTLEELNINHAFFKIYYYGNPKKLKSELAKFNYQLKDDTGSWEIYLNE